MDIDLRYGLGVLGLDEDLEAYNSTIVSSNSSSSTKESKKLLY